MHLITETKLHNLRNEEIALIVTSNRTSDICVCHGREKSEKMAECGEHNKSMANATSDYESHSVKKEVIATV